MEMKKLQRKRMYSTDNNALPELKRHPFLLGNDNTL